MVEQNNENTQGFEAPEVDLAAQAPELHRQCSDGLQVSPKGLFPFEFIANGRCKTVSDSKSHIPENRVKSFKSKTYRRLQRRLRSLTTDDPYTPAVSVSHGLRLPRSL